MRISPLPAGWPDADYLSSVGPSRRIEPGNRVPLQLMEQAGFGDVQRLDDRYY
jgi:hypothetical protein